MTAVVAATTLLLAGLVTRTAAASPAATAPQAAIGCGYSNQFPQIKLGSKGAAVREAQCYLNGTLTNTHLAVDGDFGPLTDAATRRFQACEGLAVDGIIGPKTWEALSFDWVNGIVAC
ncbi:peptidoglycan-binding protein [Streptomyces sp. NPDC059785]|uniref:peptidoglycan-binding domain-containing protein n=1 Tax=Streptomyces sp. NPDC059785 TaxID=3346945 RepID=UPI003651483E